MEQLTDEIWKTIVEFPDYEVSSHGRVRRRVDGYGGVKAGSLRRPARCSKSGHLYVPLHNKGRCANRLVHRLVAAAFLPNPDNKPVVAHKDDNPANNHVSNLRWSTTAENSADALRNGRIPKGERRAGAKLTASAVREIRQDARSESAIAADFGVTRSLIGLVRRGEIWRHVA